MAVRLHGTCGSWLLPTGECFLGRGKNCAVRLDDPRVSRVHARLIVGEHRLWVEDLGSRNGVFVEGKRISGRCELRHGQVLVCGPLVLMVSIDVTLPHPRSPVTNRAAPAADDHADTEAMLPAMAAERPTTHREIAPAIRQALQQAQAAARGSELLPNSSPEIAASALQEPAASAPALAPRPAAATTEVGAPVTVAAPPTSALEPASGRAVRRRWQAAGLDAALAAVLALSSWGLAVIGSAAALGVAGMRWDRSIERAAPPLPWSPGALLSAWQDLPLAASASSAALGIACLTIAAMVASWVSVWLFYYALPTATHGGPWHYRRLHLEIVRLDGSLPTLPQAALRWLLAGLLAPAALLTLARRQRGWHDIVAQCHLRPARAS
ncbi:MAG: FHA domain-containing protein [Planctomycetota bacterium]|nr:FHA domain-containing protein [Planctomycetota bacterium]